MAKYQLSTKLWKDPEFEEFSLQAKLIFIYLCTNELTTENGIYSISLKTIAHETGISLQTVKKLMAEGFNKSVCYNFEHKNVSLQ